MAAGVHDDFVRVVFAEDMAVDVGSVAGAVQNVVGGEGEAGFIGDVCLYGVLVFLIRGLPRVFVY